MTKNGERGGEEEYCCDDGDDDGGTGMLQIGNSADASNKININGDNSTINRLRLWRFLGGQEGRQEWIINFPWRRW